MKTLISFLLIASSKLSYFAASASFIFVYKIYHLVNSVRLLYLSNALYYTLLYCSYYVQLQTVSNQTNHKKVENMHTYKTITTILGKMTIISVKTQFREVEARGRILFLSSNSS